MSAGSRDRIALVRRELEKPKPERLDSARGIFEILIFWIKREASLYPLRYFCGGSIRASALVEPAALGSALSLWRATEMASALGLRSGDLCAALSNAATKTRLPTAHQSRRCPILSRANRAQWI